MPELLFRQTFQAAQLMREHPLRLHHANKQLVFDLVCPAGTSHQGEIEVTRWKTGRLPDELSGAPVTVSAKRGFFDYPPPPVDVVDWHLNFADPRLFAGYAGPLLAQDELQVAEHPALGALREALAPMGQAITEDDNGPTPVVVMGVERRCALVGIYGNQFARSAAKAVKKAVRPLSPPTKSNILAIAAPVGRGEYSQRQIERILLTAHEGFAASRAESQRVSAGAKVVVHTGFWGCGAFGGNRVLMVALQLIAARMAQVDVCFHLGDESGAWPFEQGADVAADLAGKGTAEAVGAIHEMGFEWGVRDGN